MPFRYLYCNFLHKKYGIRKYSLLIKKNTRAVKQVFSVLFTFFIISQSTGQCKAMFRFAAHCFALPVIWLLNYRFSHKDFGAI